MQGATQLEMQDAPALGRDFTISQETVYQTIHWNNHMLRNCALRVQDLVVIKTYFSWISCPR